MNEIDVVESTMSTDVGDATANRFRYQWVCSAISCCALLDDKADIEEVFCEHHEDILLKRRDGKYIGVQVKTRDSTQPLWSASDEIVLKSFARFTVLPVPSILIIDSPTKNISDDENPELVASLYKEIYQLAIECREKFQMILIDSDFVSPQVEIPDLLTRRMAGTEDAPSLIPYYEGP